MSMPYVIAITGKKGSGKTLAAQALVDNDKRFVICPLGHPLKKAVRALFGWDPRYTDGDRKDVVDPAWGVSPRTVMQLLGDDFMRVLMPKASDGFRNATGRLFWVKRLLAECEDSGKNFIVIPDLRDPADYAYLQTHTNLMVIQVNRPSQKVDNDSHSSENGFFRIPAQYLAENDKEGNTWPFRAGIINIFLKSGFAQGVNTK